MYSSTVINQSINQSINRSIFLSLLDRPDRSVLCGSNFPIGSVTVYYSVSYNLFASDAMCDGVEYRLLPYTVFNMYMYSTGEHSSP